MGSHLLRLCCIHLHDFDPGIFLRGCAKIGLELSTWLACRRVKVDKNGAGVLEHLAVE